MTQWKTIDARQVSALINFNAAELKWTYDTDPDSMFGKQAEGTARLYNLLSREKIALLADEVGMGKTYQALGVAVLAWKQNPDARILIIAPNNSVASNWCDEYHSFIKKNYRTSDNIVRTTLEQVPVYSPYFCSSLQEIADIAKEQWCHLFVAKTSSFSYVQTSDTNEGESRQDVARRSAAAIRDQIVFDFDLLIVDEAHYFRNRSGGSLRVNAAEGFFRGDNANPRPLAKRVLLLTATPNHSGVHDIQNIVRYFDKVLAKQKSEEILSTVGVRRFRRLAGKNKYQYRKEVSDRADFGDDIEAELFFALYQKRLAEMHKGASGRRFMYGYLEGFESMTPPDADLNNQSGESDRSQDSESADYHQSEDTGILQTLANAFKRISGKPPAHPKYNTFIDIVTDKVQADAAWRSEVNVAELKHLVFTRRIPSVTEITGRINQIYDTQYLKKISAAARVPLDDLRFSADTEEFRRRFDEKLDSVFLRGQEDDASGVEDDQSEGESGDSELSPFAASRVFDLFTVRKKAGNENVVERTHASNFRTRFIRKESPYSLFFEPAADYKMGAYPQWKAGQGTGKINYRKEAADYRTGKGRAASDVPSKPDTLWALFYTVISGSQGGIYERVKDEIDALRPERGNAFAKYLQKGILFASSSLIELYCWFLESLHKGNGMSYDSFLDVVAEKLPHSHLLSLLCEAALTFHIYAEKVCAATAIERIKREKWRFFNNQNPAAAVTGATHSRERHIKAFNSPFFPNVLVATSVFQEGVNLQFYCRNVHHYGIAWTPGDNEQRVGRIDRLFSLTERRLAEPGYNEDAYLLSRYPFLQGTLDETQLISFLKRKLDVETITDNCGAIKTDKEIDVNCSVKEWQLLLRKPVEESNEKDPYPADHAVTSSYEPQEDPYPQFNPEELLNKIDQSLNVLRCRGDVIDSYTLYIPDKKTSSDNIFSRRVIGMVDVDLKNRRKQPFYIELFFSNEFSGIIKGLVYCLRLVTPFDDGQMNNENNRNLHDQWVEHGFLERYPLVKLAINGDGEFRACMAVDLPLLFDTATIPYLDNEEISLGLSQLLWGADRLEQATLGKDLHIDTHGFKQFGNGCEAESGGCGDSKEIFSDIDADWNESERCLVKEFSLNSNSIKGYGKDVISMLFANYDIPALCFYRRSGTFRCRHSFPFVDLQKKEFDLLKSWFAFSQSRFSD